MPSLLHIDVSPRGNYSISRQLSAAAAKAWQAKHAGGKVTTRDLTRTPLTFVDLDWILGSFATADQQTEQHRKALALSDELIAELAAADTVILGTPMYNFAIPAALKAWIDHIVRDGKTFRYGESGPEGLLKGKKGVIAIASGGSYAAGSGLEFLDHETGYLKFILGFIGITDVSFVHGGGTMQVATGQVSSEEFLKPLLEQAAAAG
jgi:FMN-dependent NADH-azoreductase